MAACSYNLSSGSQGQEHPRGSPARQPGLLGKFQVCSGPLLRNATQSRPLSSAHVCVCAFCEHTQCWGGLYFITNRFDFSGDKPLRCHSLAFSGSCVLAICDQCNQSKKINS